MDIYYGILFFIFGTILGSFLNVCIYRIPRGESILYPPSHCVNCNRKIKPYDLIPIVSYIILRGKCRYCSEKIQPRYCILEFATGFLYFLIYINLGIGIEFIKYMVFVSIMIVIGVIDFDTTDVYFKTTAVGIIFALMFLGIYVYMGFPVKTYIYGGLFAGLFLALIIFATRGGMGWGDVEIVVVCGLFLGFKYTVFMMFLAFIMGAVIGFFLILLGKKSRKDYIPFGPFIVMSSFITVFLGQSIINWYLF
ncbi:prepilin peptidase [Clostridium sp.]|jgi:leader peptidase (prepilin peptidase)/N-methyltransferase|uniref:prepilin peptidase n=1 Tax=Clostridium sp. TaxID=1506 RepID=UPI002FDEA24F